jgi:hypothetical protein
MMRSETQSILERVIEKAAKLRHSTFLAEIEQGGWKISFRQRDVIVTRPPDEARDAFVLNLRFFIMGNEATSFRSLATLVDDPELSDEWKDRFQTLRSAVNDMLATAYGEYRFGGACHRFSNRQIMNTFLYGGLAHANDADAVARLQEWSRHAGIVAWLEMWFISTLRTLCMVIFLLSEFCEAELNGSVVGQFE